MHGQTGSRKVGTDRVVGEGDGKEVIASRTEVALKKIKEWI
jgi:hypothetical protein